MSARYGIVLACLMLGCLCEQARSADEKGIEPTSQMRIRSLEDALTDLKLLAKVVGQEASATYLEAQIKHWLPKGFEGIDTKKPIFLYAGVTSLGQAPFGVALVPVSNEAAFIKLIEQTAEVKTTKEGVFFLFSTPSLPLPIYVRFKDGYACVSPFKFTLEDGKLLVPARFLRTPVTESVSLQIRFDRLPAFLKQSILSPYETMLKEGKSQNSPRETAIARAVRLATLECVAESVTRLVEDGEELNLEIDLGKEREKAKIKITLRAKPNTALGAYVASMNSESLFAGWVMSPQPVVQFGIHGKLPMPGIKLLDANVREIVNQTLRGGFAGKGRMIYDTLKPTIDAGGIDIACSWRGPTVKGQYTQVMGFKILEADKLEQVIKENPEPLDANIKFGIAQSGSYQIHSAQMSTRYPEEKLFGEGIVYFAFRKDALLVVHGDGLPELKEALLAKPQKSAALEGEIRLGKAMQSFASSFRKLDDALKEKFQKHGADSAKITLEGGDALRLNLEVGFPLLEYAMQDVWRAR